MDNRDKMIGEITERLQIRLDRDDPAFVLVELNRLMLEEASKDLAEAINEAGRSIGETLNTQTNALIAETQNAIKAIKETTEAAELVLIRATKRLHDDLKAQHTKPANNTCDTELVSRAVRVEQQTAGYQVPKQSASIWSNPLLWIMASAVTSSTLTVAALHYMQ